MKLKFKVFSVLLALVFILSVFSACEKSPDDNVPEPDIREGVSFVNSMPVDESPNISALPTLDLGLAKKIAEKNELNEDSKGWLKVNGTSLDDVIMYKPDNDDVFYYLRKDFFGQYLFAGTYFLDIRSVYKGGRDGMSRNSVIYGHSMNDNPNDTIFSQLKKYKDPAFAKDTPYIYFSTEDEGDMAWEVFSVFVTHYDVPYNIPDLDDAKFLDVITDVRSKSLYDYDVEVTPEDKVLTLSTCLYEVNGQKLSYPNDYRYVIMAKLVPANEILRTEAVFEINPDVVPA